MVEEKIKKILKGDIILRVFENITKEIQKSKKSEHDIKRGKITQEFLILTFDSIIKEIEKGLKNGNEIFFKGKFRIFPQKTKATIKSHPRNKGEKISIPSKTVIKIKVSKK